MQNDIWNVLCSELMLKVFATSIFPQMLHKVYVPEAHILSYIEPKIIDE